MAKLFTDSSDGLAQVEKRIKSCFRSDSKELSDISAYLLGLGGKRVRPLLALSTARLFGMNEPSQALIDAAAGIELIHMATLLHDDIIDDSPTRRHKTSPFKKYGLAPSLLAGDFLLARAFGLCAHLDLFIIEATEQACVELTEGENLEGTLAVGEIRSLEEYITVVEKKTASLFTLATAVGSHLNSTSSENVNRLKEFGRCAGITFQMVDDILDVTAEEDLLGKPTGTDLRQKTPSLINVLWLLSGDKSALDFFKISQPTSEEAKEAAYQLRKSSIVEDAKKIALQYASEAKQNLFMVDDPKIVLSVQEALSALVDYTLERCS